MNPGNSGKVTDLRAWLKRKPWPDAVRCDGKTIVRITANNQRWSEASEAILALKTRVVEALDRKGEVVRATDLSTEPDQTDMPARVETHWPATELGVLAQIIADSNDRAAARHENAYRLAFERVLGLVELCLARVSGLEEAWTSELSRRAELVEERELTAGNQASNAQGEQLLATVMQHGMLQMSKPAPHRGPAKPNGGT